MEEEHSIRRLEGGGSGDGGQAAQVPAGIVGGDNVAGDKVTVGDVEGRSAVAVGRGARASIFNIDIRLLPLVLVLLGLVAALAYFLVKPPDKPEVMDKDYNVAVAEFRTQDENGNPIQSEEGLKFGNWLHGRLEKNLTQVLSELYDGTVLVWPPEYTGVISGATPEEREANAAARARQINANVIIYGALEPEEAKSSTAIEFFVNHESFSEGADIKGGFRLGGPVEIANPFVQGLGIVENIPLSARAEGLSLLAIGLAYYAIDDFENAVSYFAEADGIDQWLDSKGTGKHVVKLLLGNAHVRWLTKDREPALLPTAEAYYRDSLELDPEYARAAVGLAGVDYMLAYGGPGSPPKETDLERLASAERGFEEALTLKNVPESANVPTNVDFNLGQVYLLRYTSEGGEWLDRAVEKFEKVIAEYEGGNDEVSDLAAHAYARLGTIEQLVYQEPEKAIEHYRLAAALTSPFYQGEYNGRLGDLYVAACQPELAADAYEAALRAAEANGDGEKYGEYLGKLNSLSTIDPC